MVTDSDCKIYLGQLDDLYQGLVTEVIEITTEGTYIRGVNVFIPSTCVRDVVGPLPKNQGGPMHRVLEATLA